MGVNTKIACQQVSKKFEKQEIVPGRVGSPPPCKKGATTL